ncbi:DUF58 domain-containing protein [Aquabacter sp. CN5-332]|uniref:DUF58 domain-containing protein n=1 Tax=Aquabacter sp. CN5-332 TaxID=3156608 RepID=UPI0032B5AA6B
MSDATEDDLKGVVARLEELIAARPKGAGRGLGSARARSRQLGGHRSSFRGQGMEFDEVRAYQMGDDVRTIDWRVTARTGKTHTKLFQEERERPVLILLDVRTFMRFGTRGSFKSVLAARAAAMLTWLSLDEGDRVGGVVLMPSGVVSYRPQRSRSRILAFVKAMADATQDGFGTEPPASEPSLADALARLRHVSRPGTLAFIISDFHDFDDPALRELGRLSLQCQVSNLFIHDALEAETPQRGLYRVSDGTGVAVLDADSRAAREAYARRFAERREIIEQMSRQRGMAFLPLRTGEDPADILNPARTRRTRGSAA